MTESVADLCRKRNLTLEQFADQAGLDAGRAVAIIEGRWTPSPEERADVARVLGVTIDDISWGHKTPIQHLWGH